MAFKQNLPLLALAGFLALAGIAALVFLAPTDEELLMEAAMKHASTLGTVVHLELHGTVADIQLESGNPVHAQFVKRKGKWEFSIDVFKEFERHIADPDVERATFDRLGRLLFKRFRTPEVKFKAKGMEKKFSVMRAATGLHGSVTFFFSYPKRGEVQPRGQYIERFAYRDSRWEFEGRMGTLLDAVPPR